MPSWGPPGETPGEGVSVRRQKQSTGAFIVVFAGRSGQASTGKLNKLRI